jgi:pyruvate kinase
MSEQLRRTRIIATLGPATDAPGMLKKVLAEGVDVVRLNFSHGVADDHRARAAAARAAAAELGREVAVLGDLQGPKIRVERFADGAVHLEVGARFTLDCRADAPPGDASRVGVGYLDLWRDVKPGDLLLLDDGLIALDVVEVVVELVHCRVRIGGRLSDRKGINRQGGGLTVAALSDKDRHDIQLAAELQVEFLAVSFVKCAADVEQARRLLRRRRRCRHRRQDRTPAIAALGESSASDVVMVAAATSAWKSVMRNCPGCRRSSAKRWSAAASSSPPRR